MSARLVLPAGADVHERDAWLAERRKGITASEIAAILGISPWTSAYNLYWAKLGAILAGPDSDRLSLGRFLEPWVAQRFADEHPDIEMSPGGLFASVERPWQMATPDRLLDMPDADGNYGDGVLELKTSGTYDGWGEDGTDEIPAYYRAQVLWQMDVLEVGTAYVSCLFLHTQQVRTYEVAYDVTDVHLMRERAREFLERLEAQEPPPLDSHYSTLAALQALYPDVDDAAEVTLAADVAENYRWARAQLAAAKEQAAEAENALRAALGDAKTALDPDGAKVCTRSVYTVAEHVRRACTVDRLNPAKTKKETTK